MNEPNENFIRRMHKFYPRLWALFVLPILLIVTIVLFPIDYGMNICRDIPRVWCNLWNDLRGWGKPLVRRVSKPYVMAWKSFRLALISKKQGGKK